MIRLDPAAIVAYGLPPQLPNGAVVVQLDGTRLVVGGDGLVDELVQGGRPRGGAAWLPRAGSRPSSTPTSPRARRGA